MRNIRLTIQYDGTDYCGWQAQTNGVAVQDVIEDALGKVLGEKVRLIGSGRTDSGVHAKGQVANFKTNSKLTVIKIKNALNHRLPRDIVITKVQEVGSRFHAQFNAKSKSYRYSVTNNLPVSPFYKNYVAQIPYRLDVDLMRKESKILIGKHDFSAFQGARSKRNDAFRSIKRIDIRKNGKAIYIDIESDGFLYNMARNIVGTLIEIGRGHFRSGSIKKILKSKDRTKAGPTAPAKGLCLMKVIY